jgi:SAM-dependent methyltransferase
MEINKKKTSSIQILDFITKLFYFLRMRWKTPFLSLYKSFDMRWSWLKLLFSGNCSKEDKKLLKKVSLAVYRYDGMYVYSKADHYISVGLSAIHSIESALEEAGKNEPIQTILDFSCGYGRVLRFLKVKFPNANITAAEINIKMLDFCGHRFNVDTMVSNVDFEKISSNKKFELIWCGSLVTHINEASIKKLLKFFNSQLASNGMCVITTHGSYTAERIQSKNFNYGLTLKEQQQLLDQFYKTGFGFIGREKSPEYGISIISHEYFSAITAAVVPWVEVFYEKCGWDNHQDVYGFKIK